MDEPKDDTKQCRDNPKCEKLPDPPKPPELPDPPKCEACCECPDPPGGPPSDCLDKLICENSKLLKKAERAKALVELLKDIQGKVADYKVEYTESRYQDLKRTWTEQDQAIAELLRKLICGVPCWECLLECRLCDELVAIRNLERLLEGTGQLAANVYSLGDLEHWHKRNVEQIEARAKRIGDVLSAWEELSKKLGEALEKNAGLIEKLPGLIATDPAKAVFDMFMWLLPRHWAIRPRGATSVIDAKFFKLCKCDTGEPDDCCGPDVGVPKIRDRLSGPLPYIIPPGDYMGIICCLTRERLAPANEQLADAQAEHAAVTDQIAQTKKAIEDRLAALEATFHAGLDNPIDCKPYKAQG